jgi:hypothetical protein
MSLAIAFPFMPMPFSFILDSDAGRNDGRR